MKSKSVDGPVVWAYAGIPWIVFVIVQTSVTFTFSMAPKSVGFLIVVSLAACVVLFANRSRSVHFLPMASTVAVAIVLATFVGFYNYDTHELLSTYYYYSREYSNVVPSERAVAFSDAGAIDFSADSLVDTTRSVGYRAGNTMYCIAPITDKTEAAKVEFWATGMNCCRNSPPDFFCDEAKNMMAHSGAVVFDNAGWFADSNRDFYERAKSKALAEFNLVGSDYPTFVRWTTEGNKFFLRDSYHLHAIAVWGSALTVYAIGSCILAVAMVKSHVPRRNL